MICQNCGHACEEAPCGQAVCFDCCKKCHDGEGFCIDADKINPTVKATELRNDYMAWLYVGGIKAPDICELTGLKQATVLNKLSLYGAIAEKKEMRYKKAKELKAQGKSYNEIGRILHIASVTAKSMCDR